MTRARWLVLMVALIGAMMIFFPLRLAFALAGEDSITARQISGTIWNGRAEQVRLGALELGTLELGLDPWALLRARLGLSFRRNEGAAAEPLSGVIALGMGEQALTHITGVVHAPQAGGGLVDTIRFEDFAVRFSGDQCAEASGRAQLGLALPIAGIQLRHGLSGNATCRGGALFLPLVGESAMERVELSIDADRHYTAQLRVRASDPVTAAALVAAGLTAHGDGFGMTMRGRF